VILGLRGEDVARYCGCMRTGNGGVVLSSTGMILQEIGDV